jgi:hypothetical protein
MEQQQKQNAQGFSILGMDRQYAFVPIQAFTGLRLFHQYVAIVIDFLPELLRRLPALQKIGKQLSGEEDGQAKLGVGADLISIINLIPTIFTWERIEELSKELLAGCTVEIDGKKHECDESGMCAAFAGNPVECYLAIISAIMHNWAPFFSCLPMALGLDDSTLDSEN